MRYILLSVLLFAFATSARTLYSTIHNQFASLQIGDTQATKCEGNYLVSDNATDHSFLLLDTTSIGSTTYRYQLRMANEHNSPRRSYVITSSTGQRSRISSPSWGMIFDMNPAGTDFWAVMMRCDNTDVNDDITDRRFMTITLIHHQPDGHTDTIASRQLAKGINLEHGFNTLQAQLTDDKISISVGDDELSEVICATRLAPRHSVRAGCCIGSGAKVKIERSVLSYSNTPILNTSTTWTLDKLQEHFDQSIDPNEGFWVYQDRDMEEKWLRLGGRYKLALVATDSGYDIIYVDGATVHDSAWTTGMLKARLSKTIFNNHYDLTWIDATMEPITLDAYASFENGVLLNLKFPVYKSQIRLSKILN